MRRYVAAIVADGEPPREHEPLADRIRAVERLMLGLRLDEPLALAALTEREGVESVADVVDLDALERLVAQGVLERSTAGIRLARSARLLGGGVTAELLA